MLHCLRKSLVGTDTAFLITESNRQIILLRGIRDQVCEGWEVGLYVITLEIVLHCIEESAQQAVRKPWMKSVHTPTSDALLVVCVSFHEYFDSLVL